MSGRGRWYADGSLLAITVFWGVSFALVKDALDDGDTLSFLCLRFTVAAVALALVVRRGLLDRRLWRPAAWLGFFLYTGFVTQTWGLETTTPSRSAFITSTFVVFVPLAQWAMFKKRPAPSALAASALAIAGTYVLSGASFGGGLTVGDWLTVVCAALYSVHIVLTGHWAREGPGGLPPVPLVATQMVALAAFAIAGALLGERRVTFSPGFIGAVLATGLVATALGIVIQTWAQGRTTAVRASLIISCEPVFAAAWSMGRGREPFDPRVLEGGALILAGVVVSEVLKPRNP